MCDATLMANQENNQVKFYHSPWSRSTSVLWLLEELGVPYDLRVVNVHKPETVQESYRAIQPHKKVPAVQHGSLVVTERAAITIYLADTFSAAGLAPALDDPMRARYLTTLVYCDAVFDPCVTAHVRGLRPAGADYSFGAYEDMLDNVERRLSEHPFAAGDRFTAADTQLASSLGYTIHFLKAVPLRPAFDAYLKRVLGREANVRAQQIDAELAERHINNSGQASVVQEPAS